MSAETPACAREITPKMNLASTPRSLWGNYTRVRCKESLAIGKARIDMYNWARIDTQDLMRWANFDTSESGAYLIVVEARPI